MKQMQQQMRNNKIGRNLIHEISALSDRKQAKQLTKLMIWYYRVIGITFGGAVWTEKSNELTVNSAYLYWSYANITAAILYSIVHFGLTPAIAEFALIWENGLRLIYTMLIGLFAMSNLQIIINLIVLHRHGLPICRFLRAHSSDSLRSRLITIVIWSLVVICPIISLIVDVLNMDKSISFWLKVYDITDKLYKYPIKWCPFILICHSSIAVAESLRRIRARISIIENIDSCAMRSTRVELVAIKAQMKEIDANLSVVIVFDVLYQIYAILVMIYIVVEQRSNGSLRLFSHTFGFGAFASALKIFCLCVVNGWSSRECERVLEAVHGFRFGDDSRLFNEALYLVSIGQRMNFGFTIGGVIPMNVNTLVSMSAFILTYTIFLIQTGAK